MNEVVRVVARFQDGRVLKGTTGDFFPNRPLFHIQPVDGGAIAEVACKTLKALFFVKDFKGDKKRLDRRGFISSAGQTAAGKKIVVLFKDGELLCGHALSYAPDREGFFMTPADTGGNCLRAYVVAGAAVEIKAGPAADQLVEKSLATRKKP